MLRALAPAGEISRYWAPSRRPGACCHCSAASTISVHTTLTASSHRIAMQSPHAAAPCCASMHTTAAADKPLGDEASLA
jgi:hypothetical protein